MPSTNGSRPDAPTRLAEKANTGDRFETQVYYVTHSDLFITIEWDRDPDGYEWVVMELHDGRVVMEFYDGQDFIGMARILDFYKLTNSEQWMPRIQVLMFPLGSILGVLGLT